MTCGVDYRHGSNLMLLWLWRGLAAVAPIRPLAWEPPCALGAALKKKQFEHDPREDEKGQNPESHKEFHFREDGILYTISERKGWLVQIDFTVTIKQILHFLYSIKSEK